MQSFSDRLAGAVRTKRSAVVVGLDPRWGSLPAGLTEGIDPADAERRAAATREFCTGIIDAVAPLAAAVKPQAAFFEVLGPAGMGALAAVIEHARVKGLPIILDGKRNDIGSTAEGYAEAWLGPGSAWRADALTVSPYLGDDSLEPFVARCEASGSGLFVLVKTSNPGGGALQDLQAEGLPVYRHVAALVESLAMRTTGQCGLGAVGAVVGATYPEQLAELRGAMPSAWLLVPGYGSQGGTAKDVAAGFRADGLGAVVNNSRGIIFAYAQPAYRKRFGAARWQEAAEAATQAMLDELRADVPVACAPG